MHVVVVHLIVHTTFKVYFYQAKRVVCISRDTYYLPGRGGERDEFI